MGLRLVVVVLFACACTPAVAPDVPMRGDFRWVQDNGWRISAPSVIHDDARSVTRWQTYNGLSCLPDSALPPKASP